MGTSTQPSMKQYIRNRYKVESRVPITCCWKTLLLSNPMPTTFLPRLSVSHYSLLRISCNAVLHRRYRNQREAIHRVSLACLILSRGRGRGRSARQAMAILGTVSTSTQDPTHNRRKVEYQKSSTPSNNLPSTCWNGLVTRSARSTVVHDARVGHVWVTYVLGFETSS